MNCPNCKNSLKQHVLPTCHISYCINCLGWIEQKELKCEHEYDFVNYTNSIGKISVVGQCNKCGAKSKTSYKKTEHPKSASYPDFNKSLRESYQNKVREDFNKYTKFREKYKAKCRAKKKEKWLEEHSKYLSTEEWQRKRMLVLERDLFRCQSCLEKNATQVHHKTYDHWKNEPCFDLVSVCEDCHKSITNMDRGEECYSIH